MNILVTGGCGFIGSHLIKRLCDFYPNDVIINIDAMTYAARPPLFTIPPKNLIGIQIDIRDQSAVGRVMDHFKPVVVYHLAAESHVCRSISGPKDFITTNINGTFNMLSEFQRIRSDGTGKFVHISTDEVFGEVEDGKFDEQSPLAPRSPYAASKASAECLVNSWHHTYGLNTTTVNMCNVFGPNQHPEKLIPMTITSIVKGEPVVLFGDGSHMREWLWVGEAVEGIANARGRMPGTKYCLGSGQVLSNLAMVNYIHDFIPHQKLNIIFKDARPTDDKRYALDSSLAKKEMGWDGHPEEFHNRIRQTINWYCDKIDTGRDVSHGRGAEADATLPT